MDVVGVAIVRHGQVLAAQRGYPTAEAGRWELPGGKPQPGESVEQTAVREVGEELGCRVEIVGSLPGRARIRDDQDLVVVTATLTVGEPAPTEHSAIRWLDPDDLLDVDWLEPDRPFLTPLRELLLDGDPLPGGATGGAVRIGTTVRRTTGPWTPEVHALLDHLRDIPTVPTVLGTDERGREVLRYLPGDVVRPDTEMLTDAAVASTGRRLREIHDALASYRPAGIRRWRYGDRALADGEQICHNDPGVYNWAYDGDEAVGLFDWDMAGPGDPRDDIGFLAWTAVPLYRDPDPERMARRLGLLASAYGRLSGEELLDAATKRMQLAADRIEAGIARGDAGMAQLARIGEPARTRGRLESLAGWRPQIIAALRTADAAG